jgi:hydroxymethylpyrimidine pyrophosphatase-like HAD family hydrolase
MIRLVLSDLDGTIVLPNFVVTDSVRQSIIDVEKQGITVAAVTGRNYYDSKPTLLKIGLKGPSVFEGGAAIVDVVSGQMLWSRPIADDLIPAIVDCIAPHTKEIGFHDGLFPVDDIESLKSHTGCLSIWAAVDASNAPAIIEQLMLLPGVIAHGNPAPVGDHSKWGIQVTHKDADKFHGVTELLKILNVPKEEILAIGDGNNDLPLFRTASIKIAMGNAAAILKQHADHIVSSIEDDGFTEAMNKYVLLHH